MIFSIRKLQEKCIEHNKKLYVAFTDLANIFDTVNREFLWQNLVRFGEFLWQKLVRFGTSQSLCQYFGNFMKTCKQQFLLVGKLRTLHIQCWHKAGVCYCTSVSMAAVTLLSHQLVEQNDEICICVEFRLDGNLFSIRRLQAHTKPCINHILELQYADDIVR